MAILRPPLDALVPRLVERRELPAASALYGAVRNAAGLGGPALAGVLIAIAGFAATYGARRALLPRSRSPRCGGCARRRPRPTRSRRAGAGSSRACASRAPSRSWSAPTSSTSTRCSSRCPRRCSPPTRSATAAPRSPACSTRRPPRARSCSRWPAAGPATSSATAARSCSPRPAGARRSSSSASPARSGSASLALAVAGASDAVSAIFRATIWNETVPDRMRGRLAGMEMISYTSGPTLGNVEAGFAAALIGLRGSIVARRRALRRGLARARRRPAGAVALRVGGDEAPTRGG